MNVTVIKALALDAFHQVLDNWVFRILVILTGIPILATFVVGIRDDGISLLFGLYFWEWREVLDAFDAPSMPGHELRSIVIEGLLQLIYSLATGLGVIFCIAATAFFVPRMIEKGAADVLFHKPLSRGTLLLARYFAGLLFVGILSCVLVGGMYLGLLVASGHNDVGILVAAPLMTYLFALVHAFTVLVGTLTRSTVASILIGSLFFFANGCIHNIWIVRETELGRREAYKEQIDAAQAAADTELSESGDESGDDSASVVDSEGFEDEGGALESLGSALLTLLDVLHFTLPKTTDADYLAIEVRKAVSTTDFVDEESSFRIEDLPDRFEEVKAEALDAATTIGPVAETYGELQLALRSTDGTLVGLWRRPRAEVEIPNRRDPTRVRTRKERLRDVARALVDDVAQRYPDSETVDYDPPSNIDDEYSAPFNTHHVEWTTGEIRAHVAFFYTVDWVLVAHAEGADVESTDTDLRALLAAGDFQVQAQDWYPEQLGWRSEWRYNYAFSIVSSLAFAAVMLLLAWARLERIDF